MYKFFGLDKSHRASFQKLASSYSEYHLKITDIVFNQSYFMIEKNNHWLESYSFKRFKNR